MKLAAGAYTDARERLTEAEKLAAPHVARMDGAQDELHRAEREAALAWIRDRLDQLPLEPPARSIERGIGVDPRGR